VRDGRTPSVARHERRERRGCALHERRGPSPRCDYYYGDDGRYYDADGEHLPGWSPDESPASESVPAKMVPTAGSDQEVESYGPQGSDALQEKLTAGRKNWMEKKRALDDADTALARSQYMADQTGSSVDPRLIAQQEKAQREADAAHAALAPLVEEGRAGGMSPQLLDLYNRANEGD
jgi:hypothetical protein